MGFCEFQAVKFSQSREIHRCTRKRQGCMRNRRTSGRGSPPDRSIRLCACGTLRTADWYNEHLNLCGGESPWENWRRSSSAMFSPSNWPCQTNKSPRTFSLAFPVIGCSLSSGDCSIYAFSHFHVPEVRNKDRCGNRKIKIWQLASEFRFSFFVKIENWKLKSNFNFRFS